MKVHPEIDLTDLWLSVIGCHCRFLYWIDKRPQLFGCLYLMVSIGFPWMVSWCGGSQQNQMRKPIDRLQLPSVLWDEERSCEWRVGLYFGVLFQYKKHFSRHRDYRYKMVMGPFSLYNGNSFLVRQRLLNGDSTLVYRYICIFCGFLFCSIVFYDL